MLTVLARQLRAISKDLTEECTLLRMRGQQESAFRLADLAEQVAYAARQLSQANPDQSNGGTDPGAGCSQCSYAQAPSPDSLEG
jgi:hypothetical protein